MNHLAMKDEFSCCPLCGESQLDMAYYEGNSFCCEYLQIWCEAPGGKCDYYFEVCGVTREEGIRRFNTRALDKEAAWEWFQEGTLAGMDNYTLNEGENIRADFERLWTEKHGGSDER